MTRVAVVDVGTNSTRLLVADVVDGDIAVLDRRSIVTRLGEGVEATGALGEAPRARVFAVLDEYREAMDAHGATVRTAVLTSATRDASNGAEFSAKVRDDYGLDATTLSGDEEAQLTFSGATLARTDATPVLVADIGGGSTELVIGSGRAVSFFVSTQVGVVRHSERHLADDPPTAEQVTALRADVRATVRAALPGNVPSAVVAVAGTATQAAAMDLELEPYDVERVEGYVVPLATLRAQLDQLASLPLAERQQVPGLHPERAPTIVAGLAVLIEILEAAGADAVTVSDRDILYGRALESA